MRELINKPGFQSFHDIGNHWLFKEYAPHISKNYNSKPKGAPKPEALKQIFQEYKKTMSSNKSILNPTHPPLYIQDSPVKPSSKPSIKVNKPYINQPEDQVKTKKPKQNKKSNIKKLPGRTVITNKKSKHYLEF